MILFDDFERTDTEAALYSESSYSYLNRSGRSSFARVRDVLEVWATNYPKQYMPDLVSRFKHEDNRHHNGAFFELYLHELLRATGFDVDCHFPIEERGHIDFRVRKESKALFYLEATVVAESDKKTTTNKLEASFLDSLNRIHGNRFFLDVEMQGVLESLPSVKNIVKDLESWLERLSHDEVMKSYSGNSFSNVTCKSYKIGGWKVTIRPIPRKKEHWEEPLMRPVGVQMHEAVWVNTHTKLRQAITGKCGKYGELDLPYIIAADVISDYGLDPEDISSALFGEEQVTVRFNKNEVVDQTPGRKMNGAWTSKRGAVNKRNSAALVAANLLPWTITRSVPELFHNPWAIQPLDRKFWPLMQHLPNPEQNRLIKTGRKTTHDIFGLDEDWPGGE